jgi:hypothetical protein
MRRFLEEEVTIKALHVSVASFHFDDQPFNAALKSTQFISAPHPLLQNHHLLIISSSIMTKDTTKVTLANSGKQLATTHGFSTADQDSLEKALRASAKTIAPTPIGKDRNALYATHKDQIYSQFQGQWDWSKTTQKWTMASIGKIFSNYLFAYNGSQSATKTMSKRKTAKKSNVLKPDLDQPKHVVPYLKEEDSPTRPTLARPRGLGSPFSFTPINQKLPSPSDQLIERFSESPFDKPSRPFDSARPSVEHSLAGSESIPKLSEIIVVVRPGASDPWGRSMFSFPLWRCQAPVDGRDASPQSLQDWRDLSFTDFLRQLKNEQVLTSEEVVVWGQYNQLVTSDMTFASAIQEQLQAASHNETAENEATFMVVSSKSCSLPFPESLRLTIRQSQRRRRRCSRNTLVRRTRKYADG